MRRLVTAVLAPIILATAALAAPGAAAAAPGPDESYLFVVDATQVKVTPGKGKAARIVLTDPSALRFSDRPYRHVLPMTVRTMLAEFDWSPQSLKLAEPTPNASLSIGGQRSRIVNIDKAEIRKGTLVLHVTGIDGALTAMKGAGSVFIDNVEPAPVFPQTQTASLYTDPTFGKTFTATATLTSATSLTVTILYDGVTQMTIDLSPAQTISSLAATIRDGYQIQFTVDASASAEFSESAVVATVTGTIIGPDADDDLLPPAPVSAIWAFEVG